VKRQRRPTPPPTAADLAARRVCKAVRDLADIVSDKRRPSPSDIAFIDDMAAMARYRLGWINERDAHEAMLQGRR
jgi:hypothetical protein